MKDTLEEYVIAATKVAINQKEYFTGPLENNVFQFSPLPWVSYTHISHTNSEKRKMQHHCSIGESILKKMEK